MNLSRLFFLHSIITFTAGVVLIILPDAIPSAINITIQKNSYLICYLLGAAEVTIAYLSFSARKIACIKSQRIIVRAMVIFHIITGCVEVLAIMQGSSLKLGINIFIRLIITVLFIYYSKKSFNSNSGDQRADVNSVLTSQIR